MMKDFTTVTETPGNRISAEAFEMMCERYWRAGETCSGKDVLEIACGAGQGLGYLAGRARSVVGGDLTENLLRLARNHYGIAMKLVGLDAHSLPFRANRFDVILLYEAIYYLRNVECFLQECRRVLRPGGALLICTANPERPDFNPSPFSTRYFSTAELSGLLHRYGFDVDIRGAWQATAGTARDWILSVLKRLAIRSHVIPKTMRGKEFLKRIFLGKLVTTPYEIPREPAGHGSVGEPVSGEGAASRFKVLYLSARLGLK